MASLVLHKYWKWGGNVFAYQTQLKDRLNKKYNEVIGEMKVHILKEAQLFALDSKLSCLLFLASS